MTGKAVLERFASIFTTPAGTDPSLPLPEPLPRYSRVVLISDFLSPPAEIAKALKRLSGLGIRGHLLQIIDPAEETLRSPPPSHAGHRGPPGGTASTARLA